jgi:peptide deformylase
MKLILDPDPILKQMAVDWDFTTDPDTANLELEMIEIMKTFDGLGLSGNQVGLLKRVFVIQLKNHPDKTEPFAMFNPKIVSESKEQQVTDEGCLSFPKLWLEVNRPNKIEAEYLDKHGNTCTITLTGIDARCFLHELDHLNGVVFTEKVSAMKLILARKKQRKYNGRTK